MSGGGKPESPIRFKVFSTKQTVEILNKIWIKAFSKTLNCIFHTYKKYIRSNIPYKNETVTLSVFPNGTIMFQGKKSVEWVCQHIEQITKEVESDIDDQKGNLDKSDESEISDDSANIIGICAICDGKNNNYMVECQKCFSWTHNSCDNLTEKAARNIPKYFCVGCRLKFDALQVQHSSTPIQKNKKDILNSPNLSSINTESEENATNKKIIDESSTLSISGELSLTSSESSTNTSINQIDEIIGNTPLTSENPACSTANTPIKPNNINQNSFEELENPISVGNTPENNEISNLERELTAPSKSQKSSDESCPNANTKDNGEGKKLAEEIQFNEPNSYQKKSEISVSAQVIEQIPESPNQKKSPTKEIIPPQQQTNETQPTDPSPGKTSQTDELPRKKSINEIQPLLPKNNELNEEKQQKSPTKEVSPSQQQTNKTQTGTLTPVKTLQTSESPQKNSFNQIKQLPAEENRERNEAGRTSSQNTAQLTSKNRVTNTKDEPDLPKPDLKFHLSSPKMQEEIYPQMGDASQLEKAYENLVDIEKDDSGKDDSPISGLKSIFKEVKQSIECQIKPKISCTKSCHSTSTQVKPELMQELYGDYPKSISIMMNIATNLQHLKYQNLEKDMEIELLKNTLRDYQSLPEPTPTNTKPEDHMLFKYTKHDIIKEVIILEQTLVELKNQLNLTTDLKDLYKKKWLLNCKEIEETEDNINSINEITGDMINQDLKDISPEQRITGMLEKAEENLRTQKINEQKQLEEILDLKEKIANQSNEIHYLRELYRSNQISPKKPNTSNISQPKTDTITQRQFSSPKAFQHQNPQPRLESTKQTAKNVQSDERIQLLPQNYSNNLAQHTTDPSHRLISEEQPLTVEERTPILPPPIQQQPLTVEEEKTPILPPPIQFIDPPNLPHTKNQEKAHKNHKGENEEPWIRVQRRKNQYQNKENLNYQPYSDYSYKRYQKNPHRYQDEPNPKYMYQNTNMLPSKNDLFNMYKPEPSQQYYSSQEFTRYEPAHPKADRDPHQTFTPTKNDLFNMYKPSQEYLSYKPSYLEVAIDQHSKTICDEPLNSLQESVTSPKHHSNNPVPDTIPEEYDMRNRKNFAEYYEEKKDRPICPFLLKGRCPSTRCIYYHPITISYEDNPHSTSQNSRYPAEENQNTYHPKQREDNPITQQHHYIQSGNNQFLQPRENVGPNKQLTPQSNEHQQQYPHITDAHEHQIPQLFNPFSYQLEQKTNQANSDQQFPDYHETAPYYYDAHNIQSLY